MLEIDIIQLSMLLLLTMGAMFFLVEWRKSRHEDQKFKKQEMELKKYEIKLNSNYARMNSGNRSSTEEESKADLNGYTFLSVNEDKKSIFSEMLKGFEEYAKLKGYHISLSVDSSIKNKVGFKFTLHEEGVSVSTQKVKSDINEYINRVMSGENFDNVPVLITPEEHAAVIGTLKARIKYMEYTHALEKENKDFYKSLIHKMADNSVNHQPTNINLTQEGIGMDSRSYSANNSANVIQGDESKNLIENSNIQVGNNVAEINTQLNSLKETIDVLINEALTNHEVKPAIRYLENIKEELEESKAPDKSLISKWLGKANSIIKTAGAASETIEKFKNLYESFGISL